MSFVAKGKDFTSARVWTSLSTCNSRVVRWCRRREKVTLPHFDEYCLAIYSGVSDIMTTSGTPPTNMCRAQQTSTPLSQRQPVSQFSPSTLPKPCRTSQQRLMKSLSDSVRTTPPSSSGTKPEPRLGSKIITTLLPKTMSSEETGPK